MRRVAPWAVALLLTVHGATARAGCENGCSLTSIILTCPVALAPAECTIETALDISRGPRADNPLMCGRYAQSLLAGTALAPRPGLEYTKIVCGYESGPPQP